jgi:hypothetical protein
LEKRENTPLTRAGFVRTSDSVFRKFTCDINKKTRLRSSLHRTRSGWNRLFCSGVFSHRAYHSLTSLIKSYNTFRRQHYNDSAYLLRYSVNSTLDYCREHVGSYCSLGAQTTDLTHLKASLNFVLVYDFISFVFFSLDRWWLPLCSMNNTTKRWAGVEWWRWDLTSCRTQRRKHAQSISYCHVSGVVRVTKITDSHSDDWIY